MFFYCTTLLFFMSFYIYPFFTLLVLYKFFALLLVSIYQVFAPLQVFLSTVLRSSPCPSIPVLCSSRLPNLFFASLSLSYHVNLSFFLSLCRSSLCHPISVLRSSRPSISVLRSSPYLSIPSLLLSLSCLCSSLLLSFSFSDS